MFACALVPRRRPRRSRRRRPSRPYRRTSARCRRRAASPRPSSACARSPRARSPPASPARRARAPPPPSASSRATSAWRAASFSAVRSRNSASESSPVMPSFSAAALFSAASAAPAASASASRAARLGRELLERDHDGEHAALRLARPAEVERHRRRLAAVRDELVEPHVRLADELVAEQRRVLVPHLHVQRLLLEQHLVARDDELVALRRLRRPPRAHLAAAVDRAESAPRSSSLASAVRVLLVLRPLTEEPRASSVSGMSAAARSVILSRTRGVSSSSAAPRSDVGRTRRPRSCAT